MQHIEEILREMPRATCQPSRRDSGRMRLVDIASPVVTLRERLSGMAAELFVEGLRARDPSARARILDLFSRFVAEVEELSLVPLAPLLDKHAGSARELAGSTGKLVDVEVEGAEILVDPLVADCVDVVALHAVRNAVDHGIEREGARAVVGKSRRGRVSLRARPRQDEIVVDVEDDGAGLDVEAIRARAIDRGLLPAGAEVSREQLLAIVFERGFSTRTEVTELSGRGIGMDAARAAARALGGEVTLSSRDGAGTTTSLRVPSRPVSVCVQVFQVCAGVQIALPVELHLLGAAPASAVVVDPLAALDVDAPGRRRELMFFSEGLPLCVRVGDPRGTVLARRIAVGEHGVEVLRTSAGANLLLLRPERLAQSMVQLPAVTGGSCA